MPKREYNNEESFKATAEIFHYGREAIKNADLRWDIKTADNLVIASGRFKQVTIPNSALTPLGEIDVAFKKIKTTEKLRVSVYVGKEIRNEWEIWIFAGERREARGDTRKEASEDRRVMIDDRRVMIEDSFDEETIAHLNNGGRVLLLPDISQLKGKKASFQNHFWCPIMFRWEPMTMGTLVQHEHPAFGDFSTSFYTEWQWWNIIQNAVILDLDETPVEFRPLLQSIDTYDRCLKQGIIFEAKVGKGSLLMAAIDFEKDIEYRPAAQQLLYSLESYAASSAFAPTIELSADFIRAMFKQPTLTTGAKVIQCDSYEVGNEPDLAIDNDLSTMWHTAYDNPGNFAVTNRQQESGYPHENVIQFIF